jgi:hypothetical protein
MMRFAQATTVAPAHLNVFGRLVRFCYAENRRMSECDGMRPGSLLGRAVPEAHEQWSAGFRVRAFEDLSTGRGTHRTAACAQVPSDIIVLTHTGALDVYTGARRLLTVSTAGLPPVLALADPVHNRLTLLTKATCSAPTDAALGAQPNANRTEADGKAAWRVSLPLAPFSSPCSSCLSTLELALPLEPMHALRQAVAALRSALRFNSAREWDALAFVLTFAPKGGGGAEAVVAADSGTEESGDEAWERLLQVPQ